MVSVLSSLFNAGSRQAAPKRSSYVQGNNNIILFLANKEHGLSNVHLATTSALLENHPNIEVHYASFPLVRGKLEKISSFARARNPESREIVFHELQGDSFEQAVIDVGMRLDTIITPPGYAGISGFLANIQTWISPWTPEAHIALYEEIRILIKELDPAVIALDTMFRPAIDATRDLNRVHAIITPNTLVDTFLGHQPHGSMFWKYPAMASGFKFPVPLRNVPENIYLNLRFIYSATLTPALSAKKAVLRKKGIKDPINFLALHRNDVPWISMTTEGASIPVDVVPPNVTCAGPIYLSSGPAADQDPELAAWLKKAPTILLNLGSTLSYMETQAASMAPAVAEILSKTELQILWKFSKAGEYFDNVLSAVQPYIDNGRLKMEKWLSVDPTSILETGDIIASIHHGGSNCYHETLASGVPHVILPMWADLYNFAALVETIGIGIWACRDTTPGWTANGISSAVLRVVDGGSESMALRNKAKEIGDRIQAGERGRDIAARKLCKLIRDAKLDLSEQFSS